MEKRSEVTIEDFSNNDDDDDNDASGTRHL
jgi:hypothetical protein